MGIYFCSYPKSGRTWFRYLLAQYCKRLLDIEVDVGFNTLGQVFYDYDNGGRPYRFNEFPAITFGHVPPNQFPDEPDNKYLFMFRGVCDTLVSQYFHERVDRDVPEINTFVRKQVGIWCAYVVACLPYKDRACTFLYEDMPRQDILEYIFEYCGIPFDVSLFAAAVTVSLLGAMQSDEEKNPMHPAREADQDDRRVRRGKIDGYTDYLSPETIAHLKSECNRLLPDEEKEWLSSMGSMNVLRFGG